MEITISTESENFIKSQLATGNFKSVSEVIEAGFNELKAKQQYLEKLNQDIQIGLEQLENRQFLSAKDSSEKISKLFSQFE